MVRVVQGDEYFVTIDHQDAETWHHVLDVFSDASLYQTWPYGQIRWGEKNTSHLVVKKKDEIVAAAQVRIFRVPVVQIGIAYVAYGPMWRPRSTADIAHFRTALRALIREYAQSRRMILRVRPWGLEERDSGMESALSQEGFHITTGIHREKTRTILVDLGPSEEDLRRRLKKKWRQTLQHSERADLSIVEGYDDRLFDALKPIYSEMLEQKRFTPGSDIHEFVQIQGRLCDRQKMRITICKNGKEPLAGSLCSGIGDAVIGLLSATGKAGRDLQAYYLLQWEEILWSKRVGKSFYDLGGINPVTNPGVYRFKAGLGGEEVTYLGVWDYCENKSLYRAVMCLEKAFGAHSMNVANRGPAFPIRPRSTGDRREAPGRNGKADGNHTE